MAKKTSSITFKDLVNSPIGIITEYIVDKLALEIGYKPLRNFISEIQTGKTPPMSNPEYYSSKDMEWIKPSDIGFEKYITGSDWISNIAVKENKATIYKPNTILIICIGGGIGRLGIVNKHCSSNQQITGILFKENIVAEFAYYFFLSRYKIFEENSSKSTLPIINQKGLGNLDFICPKEDIQKEIVRFLDYCKECLDEEIYPKKTAWNLSKEILDFANRTFKAYYTQKELLKEYKNQLTLIENLNQAILQEAVQGKLVPQDPNDEPASQLLERIKAEKAKTGKKEKPLPPIKPEEIPFEIPKNWVWCRLGEVINFTSGNNFESTDFFKGNGVKCIKITNAGVGQIIETDDVLPFEFLEKHSQFIVNEGDLILALTRPYISTGLKISICPPSYHKSLLNQRVAVIRPISGLISSFLFQFLSSSIILKIYQDKFDGQGQQPNLKKEDVTNLFFPLPPLSEQQRIVAEIEKQLGKTKELKAHIIANQQATEQLLKALLHGAFEVEEKEEKLIMRYL